MTATPGPAAADGADAAAMAGWAQLLADVVDRRLRPGAGTDLLAPSWDGAFDDAFAEVTRAMLRSRLDALPPEQFVALYRELGGDGPLLAAMTDLVAVRAAAARRERDLSELQHEATVAGRLPLDRLTVGETLDVGLFDPDRPDLAAYRHREDTGRRPLHRVLRLRTEAGGPGTVRVVADTWVGAVWAEPRRSPPIAPLTPARVGTRLPESDVLAPELTLHAPLTLERADGATIQPPGVVGYARTLDGRLLLDPPTTPDRP